MWGPRAQCGSLRVAQPWGEAVCGEGVAKSQLDFKVISQPLLAAPPSSSSPSHLGMFQCFLGTPSPSPNPILLLLPQL